MLGRGKECDEREVGKGKEMCSQYPGVTPDVLLGWFFLQAGLTCRDSHGNCSASAFSAQISARPQQKFSVVFQPGSSLWGAVLGAVIPQISSSLLIGNISWQDTDLFSKQLLGLEKFSLDKPPCSSELQTPPRSVSSGLWMFNLPFEAAGWGIFGAEAWQRKS